MPPARRIRLAGSDGIPLDADYSPEELALVEAELASAKGRGPEEQRAAARAVVFFHECKALLDATLLPEEPEQEARRGALRDPVAARDATREGIARVDRGADEEWKRRALAAILAIARGRETFTPDDLWEQVEKPDEPRALGPVMLQAMRLGYCEATGRYVRSQIPSRHQNPIREYRSLLYVG